MRWLAYLIISLPFLLIYGMVIRMEGLKDATIGMLLTIVVLAFAIGCFAVGITLLG